MATIDSWSPATCQNSDNLNDNNCDDSQSGEKATFCQNGDNESLYLHGLKHFGLGNIT